VCFRRSRNSIHGGHFLWQRKQKEACTLEPALTATAPPNSPLNTCFDCHRRAPRFFLRRHPPVSTLVASRCTFPAIFTFFLSLSYLSWFFQIACSPKVLYVFPVKIITSSLMFSFLDLLTNGQMEW
jgi:hypothetical protein